MRFEATTIDGAWTVELEPRADDRGWFARAFCVGEFAEVGVRMQVVQANLVESVRAGTVRGLHYQLPPAAEAKLVRCVTGRIFDVAVDMRQGSTTFGEWFGVELSAEEGNALYVPPGCAHGYQVLESGSRAFYLTDAPYSPEQEAGVHHADSDIGIRWPLPPIEVSAKDAGLPPFSRAPVVT